MPISPLLVIPIFGALLRGVEYTQNFDTVILDAIGDEIGKAGHADLADFINVRRTPKARPRF